MLELREKSLRFFHEMRNNQTDEIAAVTVLVGVQLDATTRRSCPFAEDVLVRVRTMVTDYTPAL